MRKNRVAADTTVSVTNVDVSMFPKPTMGDTKPPKANPTAPKSADEVMWDLLDILESKGMISMPPILKGEEVGQEHFGDPTTISLEVA